MLQFGISNRNRKQPKTSISFPIVFGRNSEAQSVVKWMLDMLKPEIHSIRMCDECYIGLIQDNRFDMTCSKNHLVVWGQTRTWPYWPAKLMSYDEVANTVEVRYFGGKHLRGILSPKDCFLYSEKNDRPSFWLGKHKQQFEEAYDASIFYIVVLFVCVCVLQ